MHVDQLTQVWIQKSACSQSAEARRWKHAIESILSLARRDPARVSTKHSLECCLLNVGQGTVIKYDPWKHPVTGLHQRPRAECRLFPELMARQKANRHVPVWHLGTTWESAGGCAHGLMAASGSPDLQWALIQRAVQKSDRLMPQAVEQAPDSQLSRHCSRVHDLKMRADCPSTKLRQLRHLKRAGARPSASRRFIRALSRVIALYGDWHFEYRQSAIFPQSARRHRATSRTRPARTRRDGEDRS